MPLTPKTHNPPKDLTEYTLQYRYSHQHLWTNLKAFPTIQKAFDNIDQIPTKPDKTLSIRILKFVDGTCPFSVCLFEGKSTFYYLE